MNSEVKKHFFSVIVLGYNIEKFIGECLDSVLSQTYKDFEAIVIDDGSTDSTGKICKQYEKNDSRVRYYFQENAGTTAARVHGYSLAKGDYVIALDGDDTVNANWLETINNCLAEKEYDCVFYNFYNWENGKHTPSNTTFPKDGEVEPVEMIKNVIETRNHPLWDKAFKRELALSCNSIAQTLPKLSMNNDTIHIFYILSNMKSSCACNEYLMNYRILPKSASHGFKLRNISDALLSMDYSIDALKNDEKNINEYKKLLLISLLKMISFRLPMLYFSDTPKNEKKLEIKNIYKNELYKEARKYESLKNLNLKEFVFLKIYRWHVPFFYFILKAIHKTTKKIVGRK
ncbi:MAG: glycosyltransferase family 2 protein [Treponema sp.]|nr:glycosyltransferase family 2 protein [Treponema sp.]